MTHCLCCQGPSCIYIVYFFPSLTFLHSVNKCTEFSVKPTNDKFLTGMHHLKIVFYQLMFRTGKNILKAFQFIVFSHLLDILIDALMMLFEIYIFK